MDADTMRLVATMFGSAITGGLPVPPVATAGAVQEQQQSVVVR
ncbi:hypothetical protein [Lentzea sp. E54]